MPVGMGERNRWVGLLFLCSVVTAHGGVRVKTCVRYLDDVVTEGLPNTPQC